MNDPITTTPDQTNEADALAALADLVLVEPDQRAEPAERYEQLRQAMKEYLEAEPSAANSTPGRSRAQTPQWR